jgi:hypothetical protein
MDEHGLITGEWDWADQTILHPIGLAMLILLGVVMLSCPRRYAVLPMILMACFLSSRQRISIAGLDFTMLRMMVLFGWMRVIARGEATGFRWHSLDKCMVLFALSGTVIHTLREGTFGALVYKLGMTFDAVGMYFLFRQFFKSWADIEAAITVIILVSIPVAIVFTIEGMTGRNFFSIFGGVREFTAIREGRLRCQGAFSHPILAGCFWASLLPLMAAAWWRGGAGKALAIIGTSTAVLIVFLCASSTPVIGLLAVWLGAGAYLIRRELVWVRWGLLAMAIVLHVVREQPVWHLLSRIDVIGGSTGWHRYLLVDGAVRHFGEWWLLGTASTADWRGRMFDVTNQYVMEGISGGFLTLVLFVVIIALGFQRVGRSVRLVRGNPRKVALVWAMGIALFTHSIVFIAVTYFGQIILAWYLVLGMIGTLEVAPARRRVRLRSRHSRPTGRGHRGERPVDHHPLRGPRAATETEGKLPWE